MKREFTGRHMTYVLLGGFGVVIAVNLFMATLAVRGFGGLVVENSYVASQNFNTWLEEAERGEALDWRADIARDSEGRLEVITKGVPAGAQVTAEIRRPLGQPEHDTLALSDTANGLFTSEDIIPQGRWIIRLTITADGQSWSTEKQIT